MPYKEDQPTMVGCMAWIALQQIVKTANSGERYVHLNDLISATCIQYESSAILGRARINKLNILEKMLSPKAKNGEFISILKDGARKRLENYKTQEKKEPENFMELIFIKEVERITGLRISSIEEVLKILKNKDKFKEVNEIFNDVIALEEARNVICQFELEGIGFGSAFPDLTDKMYRSSTENIDQERWSEARRHGVDLPEKPDMLTLEEQENMNLHFLAAYTAEFYPELIEPLELNSYLDT